SIFAISQPPQPGSERNFTSFLSYHMIRLLSWLLPKTGGCDTLVGAAGQWKKAFPAVQSVENPPLSKQTLGSDPYGCEEISLLHHRPTGGERISFPPEIADFRQGYSEGAAEVSPSARRRGENLHLRLVPPPALVRGKMQSASRAHVPTHRSGERLRQRN